MKTARATPLGSSPEDLDHELAEVERELALLNTVAGRRLTAEAFLAEAIENAGTTVKHVEQLQVDIERLQANGRRVDEVRAALRVMRLFVRSPYVAEPPNELRRVRPMCGWTQARVELAPLDTDPMQLFALAVLLEVRDPASKATWGTQTSSTKVRGRMAELAAKRERLGSRLATLEDPR